MLWTTTQGAICIPSHKANNNKNIHSSTTYHSSELISTAMTFFKHVDYRDLEPHEAHDGKHLEEGPCAKIYSQMIACANRKGIKGHPLHQGLSRPEMLACPKEAHNTVKCIHQHPESFDYFIAS